MSRLSPAIDGLTAYVVPRHPAPVVHKLDSGEGMMAPGDLLAALADADADTILRRYPDRSRLEAALAERFGVDPRQVIVTAGGDDALDRACRALLAPGRRLVFPSPSFEMIERYARWTGAEVTHVAWPTPAWPLDDVLAAVGPDVTAIAVVSPNNPTGGEIDADGLLALRAATEGVVLLLDHAYVEFSDTDLTSLALSLPDVIVFRTLSKAWGLAGLRVGYAVGPVWLIDALRAAGNPYSVSGPALFLAEHRLTHGAEATRAFVDRVKNERAVLDAQLRRHGLDVARSSGNFSFARSPRVPWLRDALAGLGISVRTWPGRADLADATRITLPGEPDVFDALTHGVEAALAPEAILFDMDGVLADTSRSYRAAIVETAAAFGVTVTQADVQAKKARGNANNDWILTMELLADAGVSVPLVEVTAAFEARYQGTPAQPGLKASERLLLSRDTIADLASRFRLGIVTGRPRSDAAYFLDLHGLGAFFPVRVCMEDGPLKPHPAAVEQAMTLLGVRHAWMIGDTVDDVRSARGAGVVPVGVVAPGEHLDRVGPVLLAAGAARVLSATTDLLELLP